jgi:hypothetical protein
MAVDWENITVKFRFIQPQSPQLFSFYNALDNLITLFLSFILQTKLRENPILIFSFNSRTQNLVPLSGS